MRIHVLRRCVRWLGAVDICLFKSKMLHFNCCVSLLNIAFIGHSHLVLGYPETMVFSSATNVIDLGVLIITIWAVRVAEVEFHIYIYFPMSCAVLNISPQPFDCAYFHSPKFLVLFLLGISRILPADGGCAFAVVCFRVCRAC